MSRVKQIFTLQVIAFCVLLLFPAPATSLTSLQEHTIRQGWHAPFSDKTIKQVIGYPKVIVPEYEYNVPMYVPQTYWEEPADKWMWVLFWGIQLADIYSTHEGIKYDCIKEANPLLPETPTIAEMATLKGLVLLPTYGAIGYENITRGEILAPLMLGGFVVHNNFKLTKKAEVRCNLR